jgi:hypothetical protein
MMRAFGARGEGETVYVVRLGKGGGEFVIPAFAGMTV